MTGFKPASRWLSDLPYPSLLEAVDEALLTAASKHASVIPLAEHWVSLPQRERAFLHGQLRAALRRRMSVL